MRRQVKGQLLNQNNILNSTLKNVKISLSTELFFLVKTLTEARISIGGSAFQYLPNSRSMRCKCNPLLTDFIINLYSRIGGNPRLKNTVFYVLARAGVPDLTRFVKKLYKLEFQYFVTVLVPRELEETKVSDKSFKKAQSLQERAERFRRKIKLDHDKFITRLVENIMLFGASTADEISYPKPFAKNNRRFHIILLLLTIFETLVNKLTWRQNLVNNSFRIKGTRKKNKGKFAMFSTLIVGSGIKRSLFRFLNLLRKSKKTMILRIKKGAKNKKGKGKVLVIVEYFEFSNTVVSFLRPSSLRIIGRTREIQQIFRILIRMLKNNPLLISKTGIGTSTILHEVVKLSCNNKENNTFLRFDISELLYFHPKIVNDLLFDCANLDKVEMVLFQKIFLTSKVIFLIRDIDQLLFSLYFDATPIILSLLLKDNLIKIIGTIKPKLYEDYFEKDESLESFF